MARVYPLRRTQANFSGPGLFVEGFWGDGCCVERLRVFWGRLGSVVGSDSRVHVELPANWCASAWTNYFRLMLPLSLDNVDTA